MKIKFIALLLLSSLEQLAAQNYEKVTFNKDIENGYYLVVEPEADKIEGVMVLLPGFGQIAESIFPESKIHNVAYLHGLLTVAISGGSKLYADEEVTAKLNAVFKYVMKEYSISKESFIIGGFSAGGTISLRYAEYCYEKPEEAAIQPKAVFTVDSPVDLFDIWNYFQREIKKNFSQAGAGEAKFVSEIMLEEIGNPVSNKSKYEELTPFNADLEESGNERYLANIGVRVYHDVDVVWLLQNRRRSLMDSNALASSELISRLLMMDNPRAEFMLAKQPGFRSSGMRHPHSWSIVDEIELIQWVKEMLK